MTRGPFIFLRVRSMTQPSRKEIDGPGEPMKHILLAVLAVFLASAVTTAGLAQGARVTESLDKGWRFLKGDFPQAADPAGNDSVWEAVDVPHDWSIGGPFASNNLTGGAGAFLPSGVAWYRKHFTVPASDSGRRVFVEFDGVMQNSRVWINGVPLGSRPSGYVSFEYELTPQVKFGGDNVLAVRCDTSAQPASRWYSGAGIYRHVRLVTVDPVHFAAN